MQGARASGNGLFKAMVAHRGGVWELGYSGGLRGQFQDEEEAVEEARAAVRSNGGGTILFYRRGHDEPEVIPVPPTPEHRRPHSEPIGSVTEATPRALGRGDPEAAPTWLISDEVEPDLTGAMRFFIQPRWAPGPYTLDGGLRRRDTPAYSEVEIECRTDAGSVVGVVYFIPSGETSFLVATSFEQLFKPLEREGLALDERGQELFGQELDRKRPIFMGHSVNAVNGDFGNGAIIEYDDPSDGVSKNLLALAEGNRPAGASQLDQRGLNTIGWTLGVSMQILEEAMVPIDMAGVARAGELAEFQQNLGSAAKWLFANAGTIKDIISVLG